MPSGEVIRRYEKYIHSKDAHVLAAAVEGDSPFLLTLDRRHILAAADAVKRAGLPIVILRPGDFIRNYYPKHEAYHRLPPTRSQNSGSR